MNIIILGAPGSGKGTQSALLIDRYDLQHLSTGDMLRREIAQQTELGKAAKKVMDAGQLVSDEIVIGMIANRLGEQGNLFDGFPRTLAQAEALDKLLNERDEAIDHVISLEVNDEEIISRMLERGRADDNEATIRNRLNVFAEQTQPLIAYYEGQGKLHGVDGTGDIEAISARIINAIDA
ncbi:adenylate kinase [Suttonella sp. R2A3]|uniref:adenylate kinase n=1 Tax=Suttonella sp. R2A3 TaxID=2908648 RepID=UPI001F16FC46|nr:adenylate kinase [Suttonella sp. R2A3]UJF25178.1 adenylate kinase [Suttonella sp. R2A3]